MNQYMHAVNAEGPPVYDNIPIPDLQSGSSKKTEMNDSNPYEHMNHASRESDVYESIIDLSA